MKRYTVGFAFTTDEKHVALITKKRPTWQAGSLNGIGGHVEESDTSAAIAQEREFFEETGVVIHAAYWECFATLHGPDYMVHCFRTFTNAVQHMRDMTDEPVCLCPVDLLKTGKRIPNLDYLIPLAMDRSQVGIASFVYTP
jgi:8-oxo-dGTP diphosphatase